MKTCFLLTLLSSALAFCGAWNIQNSTLHDDNGQPFHILGASWFGLETGDKAVNGLWAHDMDFYLSVLRDVGVNVLRVPLNVLWAVYDWDCYPDQGFVAQDPAQQHTSSRQMLHNLFRKLNESDIHVMLDMYRATGNKFISELWYDPTNGDFTSDTFHRAWIRFLDEYGHYDNLMALDLLNEPHGRATWGTGDPSTDWRLEAEDIISIIETRFPGNRWIYVVEGVGWGKDLSRAGEHPIRPPATATDRVAYSPHSYGKSVTPSTPTDDTAALRRDWDTNFGYLREKGHAIWTGEWGGRTNLDGEWMNKYTDYLLEKNMTDAFFWSLGPNSGDVGGLLLDDWTTVDAFKKKVMQKGAGPP